MLVISSPLGERELMLVISSPLGERIEVRGHDIRVLLNFSKFSRFERRIFTQEN